MYKVLKKEKIAENTYLMQIYAPEIAMHAKAGQFVILRIDEDGERIPLTIADFDRVKITLVFLAAGKTTDDLSRLRRGDRVLDLVGPLGNPSNIMDKKFVCVIGGGVGIAAIYPIAREYSRNGAKLHCILGVKSKKFLFWRERFEKIADRAVIISDDGTIGSKGNVVDALVELNRKHKYDLVVAVGPTIMMKFVAKYTYQRIKTIASLNPIMIDGMGMCGGCRVMYDNKIRFTCVDGPEFDAHHVNFDELLSRNSIYKEEEEHICRLAKKQHGKR